MEPKKLKVKYLKAYDFKISLATGIYGGITPNGLINLNFFNERYVLPDSETVEIDNKGLQVGTPVSEKDGDITRELQTGVLLDVNTAKIVVRWLESKIKEHDRILTNKDGSRP